VVVAGTVAGTAGAGVWRPLWGVEVVGVGPLRGLVAMGMVGTVVVVVVV